MLRRRATSNMEQEGGREEKRQANGESAEREGRGDGGRDEPARRIEGGWCASEGKKNERGRERKRQREYDFSCVCIDIFMGVHRF